MLSNSKRLAACETHRAIPVPECEPILKSSKAATRILAQRVKDGTLLHEYNMFSGYPPFQKAITDFVLGQECRAVKEGTAVFLQTFGGSGALRAALDLSSEFMQIPTFHVPKIISQDLPFVIEKSNAQNVIIYEDVEDLTKSRNLKDSAAIIDVSVWQRDRQKWNETVTLLRNQGTLIIITAFDIVRTGEDSDFDCIRELVCIRDLEFLCCFGFGGCFGVREDRPGAILAKAKTKSDLDLVSSCLQNRVLRGGPSVAPQFAAAVITEVLNNDDLRKQWKEEIANENKVLRS